jgi:hypothetical protein
MGFLSGLSVGAKFVFLIPILVIVWTIIIGGPVNDLVLNLPFSETDLDLQSPLEFFANTIASLLTFMPWLEPMFNVIIWAIQIKFLFVIIEIFWRVTSIVMA